ncbi:efflux RND transporter periplasmic adaptor subunit [Pseudomonas sp. X10]
MNLRTVQARMRLGGLFALMATGALALVWWSQRPQAAPVTTAAAAVEVNVATVQKRQMQVWDEFSGRFEAIERVAVRSRVSGQIKAINFTEGQRVGQGDLLLSIDPAPFAAVVEQAQAQVAAARTRLDYARAEAERARRLWPSRAIAQNLLEQRESELREADASLKAAQASLRMARLELDYTEIRAPIAGRIGRREVTVGNLVEAGANSQVLTTLVSIDPIHVAFDADEQAVVRALGDTAQWDDPSVVPVRLLEAGKTVAEGRLQLIDNQVDNRTGTVRVQAVFPNPEGRLMPGQFARLHMGQAQASEALLVDERAIGTDQDRRYVMVLEAGDKVAYREVSLGARVAGSRIISSGLAEGERIVVNGLQRIRPGTVVVPLPVAEEGGQIASVEHEEVRP